MNPIQFYNTISLYANVTKRGRYYFSEINEAVKNAVNNKINSITDTANQNQLNGIDRIQKFRDELYTLIKPFNLVITTTRIINDVITEEHAIYPTDYRTFAGLSITINSNTTYARDTTYGQIGPMLDCSFRKSNNKKPYFLEDATGLRLFRGIGGTFSGILYYVKKQQDFYMGTETDLIEAGTGVLTITTNYTAIQDSIYNGITYISGTQFTTNGVLTDLTSGEVILSSILVNTDMPEKTHDQLAKMAAEILMGVNSDFDNAGFAEKEVS